MKALCEPAKGGQSILSAAMNICITQKDCGRLGCAAISAISSFALLAAVFCVPSSGIITVLTWPLVVAVDLYVIFLLICTSVASSAGAEAKGQRSRAIDYLPSRPGAIAILFLYLTTLVAAFAALYRGSEAVGRSFGNQSVEDLTNISDALYFSAVTMTTLGYGDFQPTSSYARWLVILQLISGFFVLIAAFPLLIGRLAMWSDEDEVPAASVSVTQLKDSESFYTSILELVGLKLMHKGGNILGFGKDDRVEIWINDATRDTLNSMLYFEVNVLDFDALSAAADRAKGTCKKGQLIIDGESYEWALLRGPNQHQVTVRSLSASAA